MTGAQGQCQQRGILTVYGAHLDPYNHKKEKHGMMQQKGLLYNPEPLTITGIIKTGMRHNTQEVPNGSSKVCRTNSWREHDVC